jgi:hypothetical protein
MGSHNFHASKKIKKDVRFHDQRCDMPSVTAFSETERWYTIEERRGDIYANAGETRKNFIDT